jgi:hypothetical protein
MRQRQLEAIAERRAGRGWLPTLMIGVLVGLIAAGIGLVTRFALSFSLPESANSLGLLAVGVSAAVFSSLALRARNHKTAE